LVPYAPDRFRDLEGYADALIALIRHHQLAPVVLVGHSVSAMIGILVHLRAPECVRALALIGPSPCYFNDDSYSGGFSADDVAGLLDALHANRHTWADSMAPLIMGNSERPELGEELRESFCRMDPQAAVDFARITFTSDHRAILSQVSVPTLILQCANDPIANEAVGAYVHAQIPDSQLVQLAATGHCPNVSAPEEVIAVLRPWLDSLGA
jgi:sigma-B regulation protein RsbQ